MATSDSPLNVPQVALVTAIKSVLNNPTDPTPVTGTTVRIDYTLDQVQAIFAAINIEVAPNDAIWASALAPDQADGELTQDGTEGNPYSLRRAFYSAQAGKQVLLKDDGTYSVPKVMQTRGQYSEDNYVTHPPEHPNIIPWNIVAPTQESERIVVRGAPGTCPVIDGSEADVFNIGIDFLEFGYLRINNAANGFGISTGNNYQSPSQGAHIHHIVGEFYRQTGGAYNVAFITIGGEAATGGIAPIVEHCVIRGDNSSDNMNNACIYVTQINAVTLRNNYLSGVSKHCLYFKHGNAFPEVGGIENVDINLTNNYIDGSVTWAASGGLIKNNIVTGVINIQAGGGGWILPYTNEDSGGSQDYNQIQHNTVLGGIYLSVLDFDSEFNNIKNNIAGEIRIQTGQASGETPDPSTNTNLSDHNLILGTDDGQRFLWGSEYGASTYFSTLSEWQSLLGLDLNSAVAANQLEGQGTYETFADFELVDGSVGLSLADDGSAVGADVSAVGSQASHAGEGYIAFDLPVIHHATTGGTVPVRLVRRRGSSGSLTVNLSATDHFRAQGVQSYAGESVTFADGEMTKIVQIPLNSITLDGEAHFYLNCTITNALIAGVRWQELNTRVVVDDGSIWSGGTVLDDPSSQIIQDAVTDNSIVYVRAGTWDDYSVVGYSEVYGNDGQKGTSFRDKQNIILRNYPGETPVITCSAAWGAGVFIRSNSHVFVSGLEITGTAKNSFVPVYIKQTTTDVPDEYVYIVNCHIHDWYGGDNTGGVRVDDGWRCVVFNNRIHDGFDTRPGYTSNTITSDPHGLHAGVHGYQPRELYVYQNTIYHVKRAMYRKHPAEEGGFSNLFARNFVYEIEGDAADFDYAGATDWATYDHAVFENICLGCNAAGLDFQANNTGSDQNTRALIYNNLVTDGGLFTARDLTGIQAWNNLVIGGTSGSSIVISLDGRSPGEMTYCDYNGYEKDYRYILGRNETTFRSFDTFAAWQGSDESQATDNQTPANPDANGAQGTPIFAGVDDWHLDNSDTLFRAQGRFALENIGAYRLGYEQIGATV